MPANVCLYHRANFLGVLLTDLGFPCPESQIVDDFAAEVGLELLEQANAGVIVVAVFDALKNSNADAVLSSPVWKQLPGVQAGKVHRVDDRRGSAALGTTPSSRHGPDREAVPAMSAVATWCALRGTAPARLQWMAAAR